MPNSNFNYFVDSHCHLDFLLKLGKSIDEVIAAAKSVGVKEFLTITTRLCDIPQILEIAEHQKHVIAAVGVHPHHASEEIKNWHPVKIKKICQHHKVRALGETGLDFYYNFSDRAAQTELFLEHMNLGRELNLPIIVHSRGADVETVNLLQQVAKAGGRFPLRGLIHCFSTTAELAMGALDVGFYISLSGILTFPKSEALRQLVKSLPLDRLLLETDAPYLAPHPERGKTNEPALLPLTAKVLAEIKNMPVSEIANITTRNFYRLFGKIINE